MLLLLTEVFVVYFMTKRKKHPDLLKEHMWLNWVCVCVYMLNRESVCVYVYVCVIWKHQKMSNRHHLWMFPHQESLQNSELELVTLFPERIGAIDFSFFSKFQMLYL